MLSTAYQMIDLRGTALKVTDTSLPGIWNEVKTIKKPIVVCNYSISGSPVLYENSFKVPVLYTDKVEFIEVIAGPSGGLNIQRIVISDSDNVKYSKTNVQNPTP